MTMDTPPFLKVDFLPQTMGSSSPQKSGMISHMGVKPWPWGYPKSSLPGLFPGKSESKIRMNRGTPPSMETPTCGNSKLRKTCLFSFWVSHLRSDGQTAGTFLFRTRKQWCTNCWEVQARWWFWHPPGLGKLRKWKTHGVFPRKTIYTFRFFFGGFRHLMLVYSGTF